MTNGYTVMNSCTGRGLPRFNLEVEISCAGNRRAIHEIHRMTSSVARTDFPRSKVLRHREKRGGLQTFARNPATNRFPRDICTFLADLALVWITTDRVL